MNSASSLVKMSLVTAAMLRDGSWRMARHKLNKHAVLPLQNVRNEGNKERERTT